MNIQFSQILIQMINFGLIVFLLAKFVYKPVVKILKQRTEKIEQGQLEAEKAIKQSDEAEAKAKITISKAREEADTIIAEAKKAAEAERTEIIKKAKDEAKKAAEAERTSLQSSLKSEREAFVAELADVVTDTTAAVIQNGLTKDQQQALIKSQIALLKNVKLK